MPPTKNYVIEKDAYLFRDIRARYQARRKRAPEEDVRQWAVFELMSSYGYSIHNIKVEEEVSDHGGKYRADIVIYKDERRFAVIECKRPKRNDPQKVMQQAKNYAVDLKTRFAVYTDGQDWFVERRISRSRKHKTRLMLKYLGDAPETLNGAAKQELQAAQGQPGVHR